MHQASMPCTRHNDSCPEVPLFEVSSGEYCLTVPSTASAGGGAYGLIIGCWYAGFGIGESASLGHPMPFSSHAEILGGNGWMPTLSGLPYPFNRYFAPDKFASGGIFDLTSKRYPVTADKHQKRAEVQIVVI